MTNLIVAFTSVFILMLSLYGFAEEAISSVVIRIQDQDGKALTDIQKESLALEVNKKQQPISHIRAWNRKQYVVILDLEFASMDAVAAAREKIWSFLSSLNREDVAAIVVFDRNGFRIPCPFTSDRNQWLHALNHPAQSGEKEDASGFYFLPEQESALADFKSVQSELAKLTQAQLSKDDLDSTAMKFTTGLSALAKGLSVVEGAKEVRIFSPGVTVSKVAETELEEPELQQSIPDPGDETEPEFEPTQVQRAKNPAEDIAEKFLASGCSTSTIDLAGIGKPATSGKAFLNEIAKRTNGIYFAQLPEDFSVFKSAPFPAFIVSWKTQDDWKENNSLKITSTQKYKIAAPKTIAAPRPLASLNNLERQLFFSQWIYNDSNGSLKPLALLDFAPGENKLIETHLCLQMNGKDVLSTKLKQRSVHVAGYLLDSENKLVDYSFIPVRLNTDQTREQLLSGGLNFSDVFLSRPGQYSLRGIIVDVDRSEVTTFLLPVKVPEFSTLTMTVPVIPGQVNQGIMVRKEYSSQTKRGLRVSYPYETQLGVFYPAFAPKIVKDKTYFVYFRIYNLALGPAQKPLPQLGMILKSGAGEEIPIGDVVISERREINKTDYALLLQFQLRGVKPGAYNLVPYVRDSIANKTIWQQTNIEVLDK